MIVCYVGKTNQNDDYYQINTQQKIYIQHQRVFPRLSECHPITYISRAQYCHPFIFSCFTQTISLSLSLHFYQFSVKKFDVVYLCFAHARHIAVFTPNSFLLHIYHRIMKSNQFRDE